jgi:hypothetical protein
MLSHASDVLFRRDFVAGKNAKKTKFAFFFAKKSAKKSINAQGDQKKLTHLFKIPKSPKHYA